MPDKFRVTVTKGLWQDQWPAYFDKFYHYCNNIATEDTGYSLEQIMNYNLKPHGKIIMTSTQGWYLRWDDEKYHTHFVMSWS